MDECENKEQTNEQTHSTVAEECWCIHYARKQKLPKKHNKNNKKNNKIQNAGNKI